MGRLMILSREGGEDLHEFKKAVKKASEAIDIICDLTEDMEGQYSERDDYGYDERDGFRDGYRERRGRNAMGRYTRR